MKSNYVSNASWYDSHSIIELNRLHNQWLIDNDYRECPDCGNILHDLYCSEHVCQCQYEDSRPIDYKALDKLYRVKLEPWQVALLDEMNSHRNNIIEKFNVPRSMIGKNKDHGIRDDLDTKHIDKYGFPCRIISTPLGDRIVFGCQIIGGIDYE